METAPVILPATPAAVPALAVLINQAYRGAASPRSWTTEAHLLSGPRIGEAQLHQLLLAPGAVLLACADLANVLTGCVYLQVQASQLYLSMLAVAPEAQAAGIGKQLLAAAEQHARQHGCARLTISVLSARPELLAWYERHGYQRTGKSELFPDTTDFGQPQQPLVLLELAKIVTK